MVCRFLILSSALISNLSYVPSIRVRMVRYMLNTSIRKSYGVGSLHVAMAITMFPCIECSPSIVVMYSILIVVGGGLLRVRRLWMVCWGWMYYWSWMYYWGWMYYGGRVGWSRLGCMVWRRWRMIWWRWRWGRSITCICQCHSNHNDNTENHLPALHV